MYRTDCRFEVAGDIPIQDTTAAIHLMSAADFTGLRGAMGTPDRPAIHVG